MDPDRPSRSCPDGVEKVYIIAMMGLAALLAACGVLAPASTSAANVWVDCAGGRDGNSGSADAPFQTLRKARDAIRATRLASAAAAVLPATVHVAAGAICRSYQQAEAGQPQSASLTLDGRDSHTIWRGTASAGPAVLSGGLPIDASELHALQGAETAWFKPSVVGQVRRLSLEQVDETGHLKALSYAGGDACIRSDFFEPAAVELLSVPQPAAGAAATPARKMLLARYPNLVEPPVPENWADYAVLNSSAGMIAINTTKAQGQSWASQASAAASGGAPQIWSHGLWQQDWADSHRRVLSVAGSDLRVQRHGDRTDRDCNLTSASPGQQACTAPLPS